MRVHFVDDDEPVEALLLRMELGSYVLLSRGAAETLLIPWHRVRRTELVVHDDDPSKGEED